MGFVLKFKKLAEKLYIGRKNFFFVYIFFPAHLTLITIKQEAQKPIAKIRNPPEVSVADLAFRKLHLRAGNWQKCFLFSGVLLWSLLFQASKAA